MKTTTATLALLLLGAGTAFAQRDEFFGRRVHWYPSIEAAGGGASEMERRRARFFGQEAGEKKYIFVYVRPLLEEREPGEFANADIVNQSRGAWAFVKMDFDKENAWVKAWGLRNAPAVIGCDIHGNDFGKSMGHSLDTVRGLLKTVPEAVAKYEARLRYDWQKIQDQLKADEDKGAKALVDFCLNAKPGYKESGEAANRLAEVAEAALGKGELAEAVGLDTAVDYHEELLKIYRATSPGLRAEIRLARLEHERGAVQAALQRLAKIGKLDPRLYAREIEEAARATADLGKAGDAKVDAALEMQDKSAMREALRKLAKDYAGTDAGRRAADASR